jgi:hypothetical protein
VSEPFINKWITVLGINPEPWAVGSSFATRRNGGIHSGISPNAKLVAYQRALQEELKSRDYTPIINESIRLTLQMLFVRQVDSYKTAGGVNKTGNYADATNLGKSTEDAMQGILFPNDRQMAWTFPIIVEQGLSAESFIAFRIAPYEDTAHWKDFVSHLRNKQKIIDDTHEDHLW